jgi:hypothetical protein
MTPKSSPGARRGSAFLREGLSRLDNQHSLVVRAVRNRGFPLVNQTFATFKPSRSIRPSGQARAGRTSRRFDGRSSGTSSR